MFKSPWDGSPTLKMMMMIIIIVIIIMGLMLGSLLLGLLLRANIMCERVSGLPVGAAPCCSLKTLPVYHQGNN